MSPLNTLTAKGQSVWFDSISRDMLEDGTIARYASELSVTGLTSNPTIFQKAIAGTEKYDAAIHGGHERGLSAEQIFFELGLEDVVAAADLFRPVYDATGGGDGFASIEVSPALANDSAQTIHDAKELFARADRPNVLIKVPGTEEGCVAIEELIAAGVPINVTLLFSPDHYIACAEAYLRGIERRVEAGQDPLVPSVASLFVSRWDNHTASELPEGLANRLGIAVSEQTYRAYREILTSDRWQRLAAAGAKPQRLLWASTGTKDPALPDTLYVTALAADQTVNTLPEKTLLAFADHGAVEGVLGDDASEADRVVLGAGEAGVDVDAMAIKLQTEGRDLFVESWNDLLRGIEAKAR
ncbi:MAG: transaldolase [Deltaproteobacteria bacterium]|nr:transaldolase [Deltaproteobacteria bacterium]MBW2418887.1 transaldolase [Deltaproteobacteria bacterium]